MPRKIKIARAVVLARKRVFCLCYTLLHERAFLHYFHLNQITSLQHLIRVSFMREAQSVEDPINITQYRRHIFETISCKSFKRQQQLPQKQRSKLQGTKKVITSITIIIVILVVIFIVIGTVIIIIIIRYFYYQYCYLLLSNYSIR